MKILRTSRALLLVVLLSGVPATALADPGEPERETESDSQSEDEVVYYHFDASEPIPICTFPKSADDTTYEYEPLVSANSLLSIRGSFYDEMMIPSIDHEGP